MVSALRNSSYSFHNFYVFKQYEAIPTFLTADLVKLATKAKITAVYRNKSNQHPVSIALRMYILVSGLFDFICLQLVTELHNPKTTAIDHLN